MISLSEDTNQLHQAAANGDITEVKRLISIGASVNSRADKTQSTPLHHAAWKGQYKVAKLLIEYGADVNARTEFWATPLHYASGLDVSDCSVSKDIYQGPPGLSHGHIAVGELLIKNHAHVNSTDNNGETALMKAALCGSVEMVNLLISHGADIEKTISGDTAFHIAIKSSADVTNLLITNGADVNDRDKLNRSPMHLAILTNQPTLIPLLVQYGANVNASDESGMTPLHYAISHERIDLAALLIQHGANVNARDASSKTPLHYAASNARSDIIYTLVQNGADVNAQDVSNMTPLHYAAEYKNADVVDSLLHHGANVNARNAFGVTPQQMLIPIVHEEDMLVIGNTTRGQVNKILREFCKWFSATVNNKTEIYQCHFKRGRYEEGKFINYTDSGYIELQFDDNDMLVSVDKNEEIRYLLEKHAEQDPIIQWELSVLDGEGTQDLHLLCRTVELMHGKAINFVGNIYYFGWSGHDQDLSRAYLWYRVARNQGYDSNIQRVENELTSKQLKDVDVMIKNWRPDQCAQEILGGR